MPRPDSDDYARVYDTFPALDELEHTIYAEQEKCHIIPRGTGEWTVNELKQVLEINVDVVFRSPQLITYLNLFITKSGEWLKSGLQDQFKNIIKSAFLCVKLDKLSGQKKSVQKFIANIYKGSRLALPIEKSDGDIWSELIQLDLGVLLLPAFLDPEHDRSDAPLSIGDAIVILELFDSHLRRNLSARDGRSFGLVEKLIREILNKLSKTDRNAVFKRCSNLKLFKVDDLSSKKPSLFSVEELEFYLEDKRLFQRSGLTDCGLGRELVKATKGVEIYFVGRETVSLVLSHRVVPECNDDAVLATLTTHVSLSAIENRIELLHRLVANPLKSHVSRLGLRYLLHGSSDDNDLSQKLWKNKSQTGEIWAKIWRFGSKEPIHQWSVIPDALGKVLSDHVKNALNVNDVSPENVIKELDEEILNTDWDAIKTSDADKDEILEKIDKRNTWRKLPFHLTTDRQRVSITDQCILQSSRSLPESFDVTLIKESPIPVIASKQQKWIGKPDPSHLIRLALTQVNPAEHAEFIFVQLNELDRAGNRLDGDILENLKSVAWLTTRDRQIVSPNQIIQIAPEKYSAAYTLAQNSRTQCIPFDQIVIVEHDPVKAFLLKNITKQIEEATRLLLVEAEKISEYALGNIKSVSREDVEQIAQSEKVLGRLPGWELVHELYTNNKGGIDLSEAKILCKPLSLDSMVAAINNLADVGSAEKVADIRVTLLRAVCEDSDAAKALENIKLRTEAGGFRLPEELAVGYSGISRGFLVHQDEWKVVQDRLNAKYGSPYDSFDYDEVTKRKPSSAILREYFDEWDGHVPHDGIAGFLALFSGDDEVSQYANGILSSRTLAGVIDLISDQWIQTGERISLQERIVETRLIPEIHTEDKSQVKSLLAEEITLPLDAGLRSILIIQKIPSAAGRQKRWKIFLRRLNPNDHDKTRLLQILSESSELILDRVYGKSVDLSKVWEELGQTSQLDVKVAQGMIIENIVPTLERLKVRNGEIDGLIWEYRYLQRIKVEAEISGRSNWDNSKINKIKNDIRDAVTTDDDLKNWVLQQMRYEIKNNSQYFAHSVPFELFQNADDSVGEKLDMQGKNSLTPAQNRFIVRHEATHGALSFYHWGREVNACLSSYEEGRGRFNRDLEKMVSLNISDKEGDSTGKFGLGFKSCLIVCDRPEVYSGELAVTIEAGILPVISDNVKVLDECVVAHSIEGKRPTLTRLVLNSGYKEPGDYQSIVKRFEKAAGVLCVLSRHIKTIEIPGESQPMQWVPKPCSKIEGLSFGQAKLPHDGKLRGQRVAHFRTRYGQFLFQIDSEGFKSLANRTDLPKIWVLNPLMEDLPVGFVIESKQFQVDIGRSQLAKDNETNARCMSQLAVDLVQFLRQVYQWAGQDWEGFRKEWSFKEQLTPEQFWASLWHVLTDGWPQMLSNEDSKADLFKALFTAEGGLIDFYSSVAAVPNRLRGKEIRLISLKHADTYTDKLLNQLFVELRQLPSLAEREKAASLLSFELGQFLAKLYPDAYTSISLVNLIAENVSDHRVDQESADALGQLFNADLHKKYKEIDAGYKETDELDDLLNQFRFKNQRGGWDTPEALASSASEAGEEEALAVLFAPAYGLLAESYSENGIAFFHWCRKSFSPDFFSWAKSITSLGGSSQAKEALLRFLISGSTGHGLAKKIKTQKDNPDFEWISAIDAAVLDQWGWDNADIDSYCRLMLETESERDKRVSKWKEQSRSQFDPEEVLNSVYDWWEDNKDIKLPDYEEKLYARPLPWEKMKEDIDLESLEARKGWIQLFYLGSCQTIGRVREGHHRKAIEWMDSQGWWDILASPDGVSAQQWVQIMDEYLAMAETQEQYRIWMQILPLYRFVTNLEDYVDLVMNADMLTCLDDLQIPGQSQALQGSGISVPELKATLGIGVNFIIRELIRHHVLEPESSQQYAYVLSSQVRKVFLTIDEDCINDAADPGQSEVLYEYIVDTLGEDYATFRNSFDIPFRILAATPSLCKELLGVGFWDDEE